MDLLLVRCAETAKSDGVEEADILKASLSDRGRKQSQRLAHWLKGQKLRGLQVFSSPARAARDMALLVSGATVVSRSLGPAAQASDILSAIGWPYEHGTALVFAHQPALGQLASLLLAGQEAPWTIKKGALWWFSSRTRAGESQTVLQCVVTPDLLKRFDDSRSDEAYVDRGSTPLPPAKSINELVVRSVLADLSH